MKPKKLFHLETLPNQKCAQNRGSGIRGEGGYTVDLRGAREARALAPRARISGSATTPLPETQQ